MGEAGDWSLDALPKRIKHYGSALRSCLLRENTIIIMTGESIAVPDAEACFLVPSRSMNREAVGPIFLRRYPHARIETEIDRNDGMQRDFQFSF